LSDALYQTIKESVPLQGHANRTSHVLELRIHARGAGYKQRMDELLRPHPMGKREHFDRFKNPPPNRINRFAMTCNYAIYGRVTLILSAINVAIQNHKLPAQALPS